MMRRAARFGYFLATMADVTPQQQQQEHELTLALYSQMFAVAGAMVGVCLTVIGVIRLIIEVKGYRTIADDLVAVDGILFLLACVSSFFMLRVRDQGHRRMFRVLTDIVFLLAMVLMMAICVLITWAFAHIHN
jgi:hypothetical protein